MYGAKAERHLFLFEKCLLMTKRAEDGTLACKHSIEVRNGSKMSNASCIYLVIKMAVQVAQCEVVCTCDFSVPT